MFSTSAAVVAMNLATWPCPLPSAAFREGCDLLRAFGFSAASTSPHVDAVCVAIVWIGYAADVQVGYESIDNSFSTLSWLPK